VKIRTLLVCHKKKSGHAGRESVRSPNVSAGIF
jgi:hypothetical protein